MTIRSFVLPSISLGTAAVALAVVIGCDSPRDSGDTTTSTHVTAGNLPLSTPTSSVPANPRQVTMKGAPVGSEVPGEEPLATDAGAVVNPPTSAGGIQRR